MSLRTFTAEVLADFHTTAAVVPSSRYLTRAMLDPLPLATARVVVELGPGTGVMTRAMLNHLSEQATLLAFEINPHFSAFLRGKFSDARLEVVSAGAECAGAELQRRGLHRVDAVLSSLGIGFMSERQRDAILSGLAPFLGPGSVLTQFHYVHGAVAGLQVADGRLARFDAIRQFKQYFRFVERRTVWLNIPPAFVYTCRP